MDLEAHVTRDIADLVAGFLDNRRKDVEELRELIGQGDARSVEHRACRLYAVGNPYGFRQITTFGRLLREACAAGDTVAARKIVDDLERYLGEVTVTLVDAPPKRPEWQPRATERRQDEVPVPEERRRGERRKDDLFARRRAPGTERRSAFR